MPAPTLLFAHANGITPGAYRQLLAPLKATASVLAPPWGPLKHGAMPGTDPVHDWVSIAADLLQEADAAPGPLVGAGHSLGAVAVLLAAAQRPGRFQRLLLIEPVAMPAWACWLLRHAPAGVRRRGPLARAARRRPDGWRDFGSAWQEARARRWFARVPDSVLQDLVQDGLEPAEEGLRRRFRSAWEARLYENPVSLWPLLRGPLPPITLLHGASSALFTDADAHRWRRLRPQDRLTRFAEAGHLLPLESGPAVAALMARSLAE